jgi:hypothetical protein
MTSNYQTLKHYRETIDSASPLVKSIDKAFTTKEQNARGKRSSRF